MGQIIYEAHDVVVDSAFVVCSRLFDGCECPFSRTITSCVVSHRNIFWLVWAVAPVSSSRSWPEGAVHAFFGTCGSCTSRIIVWSKRRPCSDRWVVFPRLRQEGLWAIFCGGAQRKVATGATVVRQLGMERASRHMEEGVTGSRSSRMASRLGTLPNPLTCLEKAEGLPRRVVN